MLVELGSAEGIVKAGFRPVWDTGEAGDVFGALDVDVVPLVVLVFEGFPEMAFGKELFGVGKPVELELGRDDLADGEAFGVDFWVVEDFVALEGELLGVDDLAADDAFFVVVVVLFFVVVEPFPPPVLRGLSVASNFDFGCEKTCLGSTVVSCLPDPGLLPPPPPPPLPGLRMMMLPPLPPFPPLPPSNNARPILLRSMPMPPPPPPGLSPQHPPSPNSSITPLKVGNTQQRAQSKLLYSG